MGILERDKKVQGKVVPGSEKKHLLLLQLSDEAGKT